MHTYTFKKLILSNGNNEALNVTGSATITKALTVAGITSSGKITITHADGLETTKLKVNNTATFSGAVTSAGRITGNGGMTITNGANVTGNLTVDNLIVTGTITCAGNATFSNNVGARTITTTSTITADDAIYTKKAFHSKDEYIEFHWSQVPLHKLYVHGSSQALSDGDAFIQTVS